MAQETLTRALKNLEGGMGREMGGRPQKEGLYVYLWLFHVEI